MRVAECASELRAKWRAFREEVAGVPRALWKDAVAERFERDFIEAPGGVIETLLKERWTDWRKSCLRAERWREIYAQGLEEGERR